MRTTCNRCGVEFDAARSDARYCSPRCRTAAHRKRLEGAKPVRPRSPLPPRLRAAEWELEKAITRLENLTKDDRFPRNHEALRAGDLAALASRAVALADMVAGLEFGVRAADITDPEFEAALAAARAEGDVSRENIARHFPPKP